MCWKLKLKWFLKLKVLQKIHRIVAIYDGSENFLLFNPLSQAGDLIEQVLDRDDNVLDHVDFIQ